MILTTDTNGHMLAFSRLEQLLLGERRVRRQRVRLHVRPAVADNRLAPNQLVAVADLDVHGVRGGAGGEVRVALVDRREGLVTEREGGGGQLRRARLGRL